MNQEIRRILSRIIELEDELKELLDKQQHELRYRVVGTKVRFEKSIREAHKKLKIGTFRWILRARLRHVATAPIIYSLIVPFVLLDLFVSVYQALCFPIYRIPAVRRAQFVVIDRHQLRYLNAIEKLNCTYCGYAAGVTAYTREVASRTEMFWCPIKHASKTVSVHRQYSEYAEFGDAEGFRPTLIRLREQLAKEHAAVRDASTTS